LDRSLDKVIIPLRLQEAVDGEVLCLETNEGMKGIRRLAQIDWFKTCHYYQWRRFCGQV
jgi:hypothetical protein